MLIPKKEAQAINYKMYGEFTPVENKLELVGGVFFPFNYERERLIALCLFNMGLQEFVTILPR